VKKYLFYALIFITAFSINCRLSALKIRKIKIKNKILLVEVAQNSVEKSRGLMFRRTLDSQKGMLFLYESEEILYFWMKNTYIPLDIGFFDKNRILRTVKTMKPHDLTSVSSDFPVMYALEVNKGWFEANNVRLGDRFVFVD
jgi:uncharacterized membrane protein (UPF0127 family)